MIDDLVCNVEKWASSLLIQHVADELGCDDRVVVCGKASGTRVVFRLKGDILVIRWSDRTGPSRDLKGVKARVYDVVRAAQARAVEMVAAEAESRLFYLIDSELTLPRR